VGGAAGVGVLVGAGAIVAVIVAVGITIGVSVGDGVVGIVVVAAPGVAGVGERSLTATCGAGVSFVGFSRVHAAAPIVSTAMDATISRRFTEVTIVIAQPPL
jgi:hypothetical protein